MKFIVELELDGYETEEEHREACLKFIEEQLNFSASFVKVKELKEKEQILEECPKCRNKSVRTKEMHEGGGVVCVTKGCGYWFCY